MLPPAPDGFRLPAGKRCEDGLRPAVFGGDIWRARRFAAGSILAVAGSTSVLREGSALPPLVLVLDDCKLLNYNPPEADEEPNVATFIGVLGFWF